MTIRFVSSFKGLFVSTLLALSACDDSSGGSKPTDAGMDASEEEEDAGDTPDTSPPRDAAPPDTGTMSDSAVTYYTCELPPLPDGSVAVGDPCCDGLGTCIALSDDAGASLGYGDCNAAENLRCLPNSASPASDAGVSDAGEGDGGSTDDAASDGGTSGPVTCRMKPAGAPDESPDYEGRCLPECLMRGAASLEQGECADSFVCVPCYSPVTGASTGACNGPGDAPVDDAPDGLEECGDALGYCVSAATTGDAGAALPQLTCGEEELCVPKQRVVQPSGCLPHCMSIIGPGACVPAFLVPESSRALLGMTTCETGELCTPCINPMNNMPTGACD